MQILKDLLIKGKAFLDGIATMTTGGITALVVDGNEVKKRSLGSIALKNQDEYFSSLSATFPSFLYVSTAPSPPTGNLVVTLINQTKNTVLAAPSSLTGTPSFRLLHESDIPALPISRITDLQTTLNTLSPQSFYLEDSLTFLPGTNIVWDSPKHINLANHLNMNDPGAYSFRINVLFHLNHRQYLSGAWQHFQLAAKRTWEVVVLTDNTNARTRRIAGIKTVSHSGHWIKYNSTGTSVVSNGNFEEKYITAKAIITNNIPRIEISHSIQAHPGFTPGVYYILYGKYTVETDSFKTNQTS